MTIDRAVSQGGVHNAKIKDIRMNLLAAIEKEMTDAGASDDAIANAISAVGTARLRAFTPQLWKLDRQAIRRRSTTGQYHDEFLIRDLTTAEFEIVVE